MSVEHRDPPGRDWVAIILAIGLSTGIICVTCAVLYDAIFSDVSGLSENATQLLVTAFGGIIGVLGSYVGYRAAMSNRPADPVVEIVDEPPPPPPPPPEP